MTHSAHGAIDMARIVLEHQSDPELRALAEEAKIAMIEVWLVKHDD